MLCFNTYITLQVSHLDANLRNKNKKDLQVTMNSGNELNNKQLLAPLPKKPKKDVSNDNTLGFAFRRCPVRILTGYLIFS
jgi:hypothetical protein